MTRIDGKGEVLMLVVVGALILGTAGVLALASSYPMLLVGVGGAAGVWLAFAGWRDKKRFLAQGYRVRRQGREAHVYEERATDGTVVHLPFEREMGNPGEIRIPSEAGWNAAVPPWAQGRRAEILGRIAQCLGPQKNRFIDSSEGISSSNHGGAA
jgi:hypothetical protein